MTNLVYVLFKKKYESQNSLLYKFPITLYLLMSSIRCANNFECKNDVQLVLVY